jgi:hypothetical protein
VIPVVFSGWLTAEAMIFFPDFNMLYMDRKVLLRRTRISRSFDLILTDTHGSKRNNMNNQTWIQHISLNSHPFQDLFISAPSTSKTLQVHGNKKAKQEIRISTYLNLQWSNTRVQGSITSRSTPVILIWSFMHEIAIEIHQI